MPEGDMRTSDNPPNYHSLYPSPLPSYEESLTTPSLARGELQGNTVQASVTPAVHVEVQNTVLQMREEPLPTGLALRQRNIRSGLFSGNLIALMLSSALLAGGIIGLANTSNNLKSQIDAINVSKNTTLQNQITNNLETGFVQSYLVGCISVAFVTFLIASVIFGRYNHNRH